MKGENWSLVIILAGVENLPQVKFRLVSVQTAAGCGRWILVFEDLRAAGYVGRVIGGGVACWMRRLKYLTVIFTETATANHK